MRQLGSFHRGTVEARTSWICIVRWPKRLERPAEMEASEALLTRMAFLVFECASACKDGAVSRA
jgi:hypothetical protein